MNRIYPHLNLTISVKIWQQDLAWREMITTDACQNWHPSDSTCFPGEWRLGLICPEWLLTGYDLPITLPEEFSILFSSSGFCVVAVQHSHCSHLVVTTYISDSSLYSACTHLSDNCGLAERNFSNYWDFFLGGNPPKECDWCWEQILGRIPMVFHFSEAREFFLYTS